jgi:hypothetical protein
MNLIYCSLSKYVSSVCNTIWEAYRACAAGFLLLRGLFAEIISLPLCGGFASRGNLSIILFLYRIIIHEIWFKCILINQLVNFLLDVLQNPLFTLNEYVSLIEVSDTKFKSIL